MFYDKSMKSAKLLNLNPFARPELGNCWC